MNFYQRQKNEVKAVIDRCYFEADQGRVSLAIARLEELDQEFPNHPNILYALGQMRRDYLGSGTTALTCFKRAHELALKLCPEAETAWFCTCNLVSLAPSEEEMRFWNQTALLEKGSEQDECKTYARELADMDSGISYPSVLMARITACAQNKEFGATAALAEILLQHPAPMPDDARLELIKLRMMSLREMDILAGQQRDSLAEDFPPKERLTLHAALLECARAIEIDPYDPTLWNYRGAWCHLLRQYDEAIRYADQAIALRPFNYPRPYINKAMSLWELGRTTEALACACEAHKQAQESDSGPEVVVESGQLVKFFSAPPKSVDLSSLQAQISAIVKFAKETCEKDLYRFRGTVTLQTITERMTSYFPQVRTNPFKGFVPMMADLLSTFSPETAFCASLTVSLTGSESKVVEYCIAAAIYVACQASGVHQRDAARYLTLMTLCMPSHAIRQYYRQAFLATSAVTPGPLVKADVKMQEELLCIHPALPALIANQSHVTTEEIQEAMRNVLCHFEGALPPTFTGETNEKGCSSTEMSGTANVRSLNNPHPSPSGNSSSELHKTTPVSLKFITMKQRTRIIAVGAHLLVTISALLLMRQFQVDEKWQLILILFSVSSAFWWLTYGIRGAGISCRRCFRSWSDIKTFEKDPSHMDRLMMHSSTGMHQGYVCRKCGSLLCERCFLTGGRTCPKCRSREFMHAWLRGQG